MSECKSCFKPVEPYLDQKKWQYPLFCESCETKLVNAIRGHSLKTAPNNPKEPNEHKDEK